MHLNQVLFSGRAKILLLMCLAVAISSSCAEAGTDSASAERNETSGSEYSSKSDSGSTKNRKTKSTKQTRSKAGNSTSRSQYSSSDPEYMLASIDAGYELDRGDPSIRTYGRLLDRLARKCPDANGGLVGDMAVKSTQILEEEGVTASVLEMLEGADIALSGGTQELGIDCSEIFASMAVMMIGN